MKLPNAENAIVDIKKLRDYSLNPNHPEGKYKARGFKEKLGITSDDADQLRQVILDAILTVEAKEQAPTPYGRRFLVDFELSCPSTSTLSAPLLLERLGSFVRVKMFRD